MTSPLPTKRRDRLHVAIILNQLATPGLGSWVAGRRLAGGGQLVVAFLGFGFFLVHFGRLFQSLWLAVIDGVAPEVLSPATWHRGLAIFVAAWCWSGITSLQLYAELRRRGRDSNGLLPPMLA